MGFWTGAAVEGVCSHKNETFKLGEAWNDGCESICTCQANGIADCRPRCPTANNTMIAEGCVSLPDRNDPCCMMVLCDVTLGDHEEGRTGKNSNHSCHLKLFICVAAMEMPAAELRISSADAINSTSAIVHFVGEPMLDANLTAEMSEDGQKWQQVTIDGGVVGGLTPGRMLRLRVVSGSRRSNDVSVFLPELQVPSTTTAPANTSSNSTAEEFPEFCSFKGHNYTLGKFQLNRRFIRLSPCFLGQEFNDACVSFCICTDTGVDCSPIQCPSEFGLDVLDPTCLRWETQPRDFNPKPPDCCSDNVRCLDNGSCTFMGHSFPNWAEIPANFTGKLILK